MRSTSTLLSSSCFFYPCNSSSSSSSSSLSLSSGPAPLPTLPSSYLQSLLLLLVVVLDSSPRDHLVLEHVQILDDKLVKAVDGEDSADVLEGEEQR